MLFPHPYPNFSYRLGAKIGKPNAKEFDRIRQAALELAECCANSSMRYENMALLEDIMPPLIRVAPRSTTTQCKCLSTDQPYRKSPNGMISIPGIIIGTRYSGAVAPLFFFLRWAQTMSMSGPVTYEPMVEPRAIAM